MTTGREQKSTMGNFSRGAELWMHQARLIAVAIWTAVFISFLAGVGVGVAYFYRSSTAVDRYALERNVIGQLRTVFMMTKVPMEIYLNNEKQMKSVADVVELTGPDADEALRKMKNGAVFGALCAIGLGGMLTLLWWKYGKGKMEDKRLRGAQLVEGPELKTIMEHREDCSPYLLADVPMRKGSETLHTMIGGAQGTGKSQQFFRLMAQVRARGKRAIVYDPTGEFTKAFYRDGVDILMNPLDSRSPNWNIWCEIEKDYHFDNMANGLIPDPAEADPFWAQAGRMVLKDVYRVLGRENRRTNADLYNSVARSNLEALHALLLGTAGATYVHPSTERTGMSLKMTVQNQLESFRFLHDKGELFSIRQWVQGDSDSWMFITARESMREALKPVLSLWIDTAIKAVLDLEPIHRERLWFFIDELPTLQKLDILKLALTNTRKYGLCCVIGIQDFSQLNEIYGQYLARTIISGCQTKLLLRVTDGDAARVLAKLMGEAELDEKEETLSYGLNSQRDGVSVFARRNLRDIVLTSQILTLPDMTGYLTVPGDYPVARVAYKYEPTPTIADAFKERDGFGISFRPKINGKAPAPGAAPAAPGEQAKAATTTSAMALAVAVEAHEPDLFGDAEAPADPVVLLNDFDPEDAIVEYDTEAEAEAAPDGDEVSPAKAAEQGKAGQGENSGKPSIGLGNALKMGGK